MTGTATELDLDAIDARANAATAGPWQHDGNDGLVWPQRIGDPVSGSNEMPDADFIAAARTDVPALVAEVRRLRAELASRVPQPLAAEPGPDITEVYDRDGHPWERNKAGLWCAFGPGVGVPTSWGSLIGVWGPITMKAVQ